MTDKPNEPEDIEPGTRTGFFTSVDGVPIHVQGDPNMSEADHALLEKLVRAVLRMDAEKKAALDEITRLTPDGYEGKEGEA